MTGYFGDPEATRDAISDDGWLRTGDIGVLNEAGYLQITDRKKDMFIVGGFNAYPAEIEGILITHPAIREAAVVGVPDERLGEVGAAFLVRNPEQTVDDDELRAWCRVNMANFKVPRFISWLEELPRNAANKVVKTELVVEERNRAVGIEP
jgi:acyl-CoA synthetase (AMP-forming)/AMP-acid ligase II